MRAAASVIDLLAMLCDTSTKYTMDKRVDPEETTGRARAKINAVSNSDRTTACTTRWRGPKLVRLKRIATQTAGTRRSSHNAPAVVQLIDTSHRHATLPRPPLGGGEHQPKDNRPHPIRPA